MKLFCAFMGENEDAFPVTADANDTIADLKLAIVEKARTGVEPRDAYKIHLFLAKACDAWMTSGAQLPDAPIKLDPTDIIADAFAGDLGRKVIHVLVKLPELDALARESERLMYMSRKRTALKEMENRRTDEERAMLKEERHSRIPEKRKRLWKDLNAALASKRQKGNSTPFSSFEWENIPTCYKPKAVKSGAFYDLLENAAPINDNVLDEMTKNVEMKMWAYDWEMKTNEATRVQFMSTVFEYVVSMFKSTDDKKPDSERVTLSVQTKLIGEFVQANGVVDFMITRGEKKICVIEAKEEQFGKGSAQDILGMEVAVEENEQEIMYGIVTNYHVWHFLKRSDDGVEWREDHINPSLNVRDELKRVASKIHAILA